MSIGSFWEKFAADKTPNTPLTLVEHVPENSKEREDLKKLSPGTRKWLWGIAIADMAGIAWMLAAGSWFDQTSKVTAVVTIGGNHRLVLIMAILGFLMLVTAALKSDGFDATSRLDRILINLGRAVSVIALAGGLSVIALVTALVLVAVVILVSSLGRGVLKP
jgi:hypothetical protein